LAVQNAAALKAGSPTMTTKNNADSDGHAISGATTNAARMSKAFIARTYAAAF